MRAGLQWPRLSVRKMGSFFKRLTVKFSQFHVPFYTAKLKISYFYASLSMEVGNKNKCIKLYNSNTP